MKISVSSYSFAKWMKNRSQLGTIKLAEDLGFDAIEFSDILPHNSSSQEIYAEELRQECEKYEMTVSNFVFPADFINGSGGDTEKEIERVKKMVDIAEILGAKSIRHDATGGINCKSFDSVLPIIADACRIVTEYAQQKGIRTMVENHGYFCQDSLRVEQLFNAVNHPNFGLLCDMGNFLCVDENPVTAVSRVAPYAFHVHAKDFYMKSGNEPDPGEGFFRTRGGNYLKGAIIGQGTVPVVQCLSILKRANYDGYVGIEYEGYEDNLDGVRIGLANLKRFMGMIEG